MKNSPNGENPIAKMTHVYLRSEAVVVANENVENNNLSEVKGHDELKRTEGIDRKFSMKEARLKFKHLNPTIKI